MPEGPEVAFVASQINNILGGSRLLEANVIGDTQLYGMLGFKKGMCLFSVYSKGKHIILNFGKTRMISAGNNWKYFKYLPSTFKKKDLFYFMFNHGILMYNSRYFNIKIYRDINLMNKVLNSIGPSWLDIDNNGNIKCGFTLEYFKKMCQSKFDTNICKFLYDQSITSGIGNYVLSEVLYLTKIDYTKNVGDIPIKDIGCLYLETFGVMRESYLNGGVDSPNLNKKLNKKGYKRYLKVYGNPKARKIIGPHGSSLYII